MVKRKERKILFSFIRAIYNGCVRQVEVNYRKYNGVENIHSDILRPFTFTYSQFVCIHRIRRYKQKYVYVRGWVGGKSILPPIN